MVTYRKKQTQREKKVFSDTSGGCVIQVKNNTLNDSQVHSLESN